MSSIFNIFDRNYDSINLTSKQNTLYPEKISTTLIEGIFDKVTYQYIPKIVKETWINIMRKRSTGYYDQIRLKNQHHPKAIADYYTEEINHYREAIDIIKKYMIPIIDRMKIDKKIFTFKKGYIFSEITNDSFLSEKGYFNNTNNTNNTNEQLLEQIEEGVLKMINTLTAYINEIKYPKGTKKYYEKINCYFDKPQVNRMGLFCHSGLSSSIKPTILSGYLQDKINQNKINYQDNSLLNKIIEKNENKMIEGNKNKDIQINNYKKNDFAYQTLFIYFITSLIVYLLLSYLN